MKNILSIFTTLFIVSIIFVSCKKENITNTSTTKDTTLINDTIRIGDTFRIKDTTRIIDTIQHPITIVGFYVGAIGNNTDYPGFQMDFLFRSNGTVRVYDNDITTPGYFDTTAIPPAEGTYIVSGDTVTTTYSYLNNPSNTFSTISIINTSFTYMEGTWGSGTFNTGGGYFFVYKQY
jgi:hypothetical protein